MLKLFSSNQTLSPGHSKYGLVLRVSILVLLLSSLILPVLSVFSAWLPGSYWGAEYGQTAGHIITQMLQTVLPDYTLTTLWLALGVGLGVFVIGTSCALAVALYDFPFKRVLSWALLLPLAMPAYVLAYAYTDFLQYSGPAQTAIRSLLGVQGRGLPEVRSLPGAIWVFSFAFYPYVYLLVRTALAERAATLIEAAKSLGVSTFNIVWRIVLPLVRPASAAGVALVLMETLADFGVSSYFGIQTFSAGIYKAWLVMDQPVAAAQLSSILLVLVLVLLGLENTAQRRTRFYASKNSGRPPVVIKVCGWRAWGLMLLTAAPVLFGFLLPVLFMFKPFSFNWADYPWQRFGLWAYNSIHLAVLSAGLATCAALIIGFYVRMFPDTLSRGGARLVGMGYAVPGAVIVVGLLLPVAWLQKVAPGWGVGYWLTASILGLIWAYLVRFTAVALQSVQSAYTRMPLHFDESAKVLGLGHLAIFRRVHWPLLKKSTGVAALLVFVDVMKELPATLVLRPFNYDTLAVVAYQLARDERLEEAALPSLALVLVGLLPVILLSRSLQAQKPGS